MPTHRYNQRTPLREALNIITKNGHYVNLHPKLGKLISMTCIQSIENCASHDSDFLRHEKENKNVWKQGVGQSGFFVFKIVVRMRDLWPSASFPGYLLLRHPFNSNALVMCLTVHILIFSSEIWFSDPINISTENFFSNLIKMQARQWDMLATTSHSIASVG